MRINKDPHYYDIIFSPSSAAYYRTTYILSGFTLKSNLHQCKFWKNKISY